MKFQYLKEKVCENIIQKILSKNKQKDIFVFHRNINICNDNDDGNEDTSHDSNYKCSLPIAGGSIIAEKPIVKMGKPIKKSETIKKFRKCLNKSKYRPIVILTDQSSTADTPKTYTKMDAIYIVIALNENNANYNNIEEKLNNVDTSLALMMQGSLSTIIVYLPSTQKFYHYRGIREYKKFGSIIYLQEIYQQQQSFQQPRPLVTQVFPTE